MNWFTAQYIQEFVLITLVSFTGGKVACAGPDTHGRKHITHVSAYSFQLALISWWRCAVSGLSGCAYGRILRICGVLSWCFGVCVCFFFLKQSLVSTALSTQWCWNLQKANAVHRVGSTVLSPKHSVWAAHHRSELLFRLLSARCNRYLLV